MGEARDVELAASLRMDGLALREREARSSHRNLLSLAAHDVHLDCGLALVPSGFVRERVKRQITRELVIISGRTRKNLFPVRAVLIALCSDQRLDVFAQV